MTGEPCSRRTASVLSSIAGVLRFLAESPYARRTDDPANCDFVFGNPNELPLDGFSAALARWSVPRSTDWYAYKMNEPPARAVVAASLRQRRGVPFEEDDIFLTNGGFAGLAVALAAVVDPGDEVVFVTPPWFFYEALILAAGGQPVRARVQPQTFDLDLDAIAAALTRRTRAIVVNSPHNPTGRIYPPATLAGLAEVLTRASERNGRTIYLLSDEAYSRIVFDGRDYPSPTSFYPHSFLIYTYGKTLLTPGQRLGYVALPPTMPHRAPLRQALTAAQLVTGYAFPNALLQHALADLDQLSIDVSHLQRKRDRLVAALRDLDYELHVPEGTFYLLPRSPLPDDTAFVEQLAARQVFCLPGSLVECPGYFRISLTANDAMIERALPAFAAARRA